MKGVPPHAGVEFARAYWRTAPVVPRPLGDLAPGAIGDDEFRLLADNLPTLCWIANGDGYIVWYNRRWYEYTGTTPEEMEGWGWRRVHDPEQLPAVEARWSAAIATGDPFEMTFPLRGADGIYRPFLTRIQPVRDAQGRVVRWFGVNTEMEAQVAAESALRAERDRYRRVLEGMDEGFALWDRDFRIIDVNARGLEMEKRPRAEIIGACHWDAYPGTEHSELGRLYKIAMAERVPVAHEHNYHWPDGRSMWLEMRAYPVEDGLAVFYRDVTARRAMEERLRTSEAELRLLTDALPVLVSFIDRDERYRFANLAYERWFGQPRSEIVGRHMRDVLGEAAYEALQPHVAAALAGETVTFSTEVQYKIAGVRHIDASYVPSLAPDGSVAGFFVLVADATARKTAEERLLAASEDAAREAAERAAILGQLAEGVIVADPTGTITFVNEAAERLHGVKQLDVGPDDYAETYTLLTEAGEPYPSLDLPLARAVLRGETVLDARWRIRRPDGTEVLAIGSARPIWGPEGERLGAVLTVRDDTERSRAEAAVRRSEARMRIALAAGHLGDWTWDARTDAMSLSARARDVFGLDTDAVTWSALERMLHPEDAPAVSAAMRAAMERREDYQVEYRVRRPDGRLVWIAANGRPVSDGGEAARTMIGVVRDVTSRHAAEEHRKLLIDELNHRVKNTLAIVQGLADQTFRKTDVSEPLRQKFEGRLMALATAHNLLTRENWHSADFHRVIADAVHAHDGNKSRFAISGPALRVPPKAAVTLAMAVHELCTNALKYGALSVEEGRVAISWTIVQGSEPRLQIRWEERNGPPVREPDRRGFGTRMIERALAAELSGVARIHFRPTGLVCEIEARVPDAAGA